MIADVRHEDEVRAAALSNKTELSRVTKELEAAKATLAQHKMSNDSLNSQVNIVQTLTLLVCCCIYCYRYHEQEVFQKQDFCIDKLLVHGSLSVLICENGSKMRCKI